jgi:hypothetical protein
MTGSSVASSGVAPVGTVAESVLGAGGSVDVVGALFFSHATTRTRSERERHVVVFRMGALWHGVHRSTRRDAEKTSGENRCR